MYNCTKTNYLQHINCFIYFIILIPTDVLTTVIHTCDENSEQNENNVFSFLFVGEIYSALSMAPERNKNNCTN